jgi:hypothetical protein
VVRVLWIAKKTRITIHDARTTLHIYYRAAALSSHITQDAGNGGNSTTIHPFIYIKERAAMVSIFLPALFFSLQIFYPHVMKRKFFSILH